MGNTEVFMGDAGAALFAEIVALFCDAEAALVASFVVPAVVVSKCIVLVVCSMDADIVLVAIVENTVMINLSVVATFDACVVLTPGVTLNVADDDKAFVRTKFDETIVVKFCNIFTAVVVGFSVDARLIPFVAAVELNGKSNVIPAVVLLIKLVVVVVATGPNVIEEL